MESQFLKNSYSEMNMVRHYYIMSDTHYRFIPSVKVVDRIYHQAPVIIRHRTAFSSSQTWISM